MLESEERKIVVFKVGQSNYCMDIKDVLEIIRAPQIIKMPQTKNYILGIINLRNRIIPVLDLKKRCLDEYAQLGDETRIIISQIQGREIGYLVDEVDEIIGISQQTITKTDEISIDTDLKLVEGVAQLGEHFVLLLNTANAIS